MKERERMEDNRQRRCVRAVHEVCVRAPHGKMRTCSLPCGTCGTSDVELGPACPSAGTIAIEPACVRASDSASPIIYAHTDTEARGGEA